MLSSALDPKSLPLILRAIYIRGSSIKMSKDFDPLVPGQELSGQFRHYKATVNLKKRIDPASGQTSGKSYVFLTRFEFRYSQPSSISKQQEDANDDDNVLADISADIAAEYTLRSEEVLTLEELNQWGLTSVLIHCWPYWREYCHSATARMNLPITLMPMINVQAVHESESTEQVDVKKKPIKKTKDSIAIKEKATSKKKSK